MSWDDALKVFTSALAAVGGASAIFFGLSSWLGKVWANRILEQDRKKYAMELENIKTQNQNVINQFQARLDAANLKLQISYGGIFERQAGVIIDIYKGLTELELATYKAVNYSEDPIVKWEWFRESWAAVRSSYDAHRILLPEDIDQELKEFLSKIFEGVLNYTNSDRRIISPVTEEELEKLSEKRAEALRVIERKVPNLKESLIKKIRVVLSTDQGFS